MIMVHNDDYGEWSTMMIMVHNDDYGPQWGSSTVLVGANLNRMVALGTPIGGDLRLM